MKDEDRGEDFVNFRLKQAAPDYVAIGKTRYAAAFRRGEEPFRSTRGEWKVWLEKTGYFEEESGVRSQESEEKRTLNPES